MRNPIATIVLLLAYGTSSAQVLCPDGTYVSGSPGITYCGLAPDGTYVAKERRRYEPLRRDYPSHDDYPRRGGSGTEALIGEALIGLGEGIAEAAAHQRAERNAIQRAELERERRRAEREQLYEIERLRRAVEELTWRIDQEPLDTSGLTPLDQSAAPSGSSFSENDTLIDESPPHRGALLAAYASDIQAAIRRSWIQPASMQPGIECVVHVTQRPNGEVVNVTTGRCNGNPAVVRSIESAVLRASPLPRPPVPVLFERDLEVVFSPDSWNSTMESRGPSASEFLDAYESGAGGND